MYIIKLFGTLSFKPVFKGEFYPNFITFGIKVNHHC
jgi:hypothetical protein